LSASISPMSIRSEVGLRRAPAKGEAEGKPAPANNFVSRRADALAHRRLSVVSCLLLVGSVGASNVTGFLRLKRGRDGGQSRAGGQALAAQQLEPPTASTSRSARARPSTRHREARSRRAPRGYEARPAGVRNSRWVRNWTCMKCDTCGSTTGCS